MYTANRTEQSIVSASPLLNDSPAGEVRNQRPSVTIATPTTFPSRGGLRSITTWSNGTKMTIMPVMNADLEAVVMVRPMFCVTNPRKRNAARMLPFRIAWPGMGNSLRPSRRSMSPPPSRNRMAIRSRGDTSRMPIFTTANVPPQISVVPSSAASARDRVVT